jgi:hypothetical protein
MNFYDEFEVPIQVEFDGKQYTLEKLKGRDYLPWCAELQKAYQDRNLSLIPDDARPLEKTQHKSSIMGREFTPDDCSQHVSTIEGSMRVIRISFVRAITGKRLNGNENEDSIREAIFVADKFIDTLDWPNLQSLALRLSGLCPEIAFFKWFEPLTKKEIKEGDARPNVSGAASPASLIGQSQG